jgi:hypothetical protein
MQIKFKSSGILIIWTVLYNHIFAGLAVVLSGCVWGVGRPLLVRISIVLVMLEKRYMI